MHASTGEYRCCSELVWIDLQQIASHRAGAGEALTGNDSEAVWCATVDEVWIRHAAAVAKIGIVAIDAVDQHAGVATHRIDIGQIDVREIAAASPVPRVEDLARAKREPAYGPPADTDRCAPTTAAYKRDQRRCIDRAPQAWPGDPAPGMVDVGPATIVEGRVPPRQGVDPAPAPRRDEHPTTVAVWCPAGRYIVRKPHGSVIVLGLPIAVPVQILITDHVFGNVLGGSGLRIALIALAAPSVEGVAAAEVGNHQIVERGVAEIVAVAGCHVVPGVVLAVHDGTPVEHRDPGRLAIATDVDPERAGLIDHQRKRRRVDFDTLTLVKLTCCEIECALGQFDLRQLIVQRKKAEARVGAQAHGAAAELQFCAGVLASGQAITRGHWAVDGCADPVFRAGRQNAEVAGDIGQARRPAWWVAAMVSGGRWRLGHTSCRAKQPCRHHSPVAATWSKSLGKCAHGVLQTIGATGSTDRTHGPVQQPDSEGMTIRGSPNYARGSVRADWVALSGAVAGSAGRHLRFMHCSVVGVLRARSSRALPGGGHSTATRATMRS